MITNMIMKRGKEDEIITYQLQRGILGNINVVHCYRMSIFSQSLFLLLLLSFLFVFCYFVLFLSFGYVGQLLRKVNLVESGDQ